ncbi:hypothetical protein DL768_004912 [Monosporascus sp. mg162]|nr:hypothetical protein DL768_004912 [Monosporascus sp. mg162]
MSSPQEMRVALLCEYNKPYQLGHKNVPDIEDTELLVKIHAAGFCHSDLQVWHGQFGTKLPMVPSHEPAGTVVRVGAKCEGEWKVGDRVGVLNFKKSCSKCPGCRLAKREYGGLDPRFCDSRVTAGFQHDGAFAEYMVADPATTVKLPPSLSFEQAAPLMCAGATVWGALEKATNGLKPGDTVAVVGIGGLGHLGVQFSRATGFRTIAVDSRPEGRQLATEVSNPALKPDLVIDSTSPDATKEIFEFTNGEGKAIDLAQTKSCGFSPDDSSGEALNSPVKKGDAEELFKEFGLGIHPKDTDDYHMLLAAVHDCAEQLLSLPHYQPVPHLKKCLRENVRLPSDLEQAFEHAWAHKFLIKGDKNGALRGAIENPHKGVHSAGGSTSGGAALVAGGVMDLAIGTDQGGSIRVPASLCGCVGLKTTHGLVPYTGVTSGDAIDDHSGPLARTVLDAATCLSTIAGYDGIDDGSLRSGEHGSFQFAKSLEASGDGHPGCPV